MPSDDQFCERTSEIDDHRKLIRSAGHQLTTKVPPGYVRSWPTA
jgi:hypothetical protein